MLYKIGRHQEGVSLNPLEFVMMDGRVKTFDSMHAVESFLKEEGFRADEAKDPHLAGLYVVPVIDGLCCSACGSEDLEVRAHETVFCNACGDEAEGAVTFEEYARSEAERDHERWRDLE